MYAGLLIALLLHWTEGAKGWVKGWQVVNAVLWIGGMVMSVVKVVGLSKEGINTRKGSKYPLSDQVIDVAVMAGVYAVLAILEVVLVAWRVKRRKGGQRALSPQSDAPVMENGEFGKDTPQFRME